MSIASRHAIVAVALSTALAATAIAAPQAKAGGRGSAVKAQTTGTYKPLPNPIRNVRDHRGPNGSGGGVSVTSGPPRRQTICAGWGC
jgi:hypothetical protein